MDARAAKKRILVADDAELNRAILKSILEGDFDVVEAENGKIALDILEDKTQNIAIVILDILMPEVDGFGVLSAMKKRGFLDYIPVIMISAESTAQYVDKAYEMGATDFINKPFNPAVVLHRVVNNLRLFNRQQALLDIVTDQVYEKHRYSDMMVNILSTVMEIKNGESGLHILHINTITRILCETLLEISDKYSFTAHDIPLIGDASSLHDIGKMAIPDEIINKPGRLTPEEFEVMKTHSKIGADMLSQLVEYKDEKLVKYAYEICLYHHERYDGRGYPCGLKGDEIPIWAQIVSIADVFDALISERVYKKAYTPDKALDMITMGECGEFNPVLIRCIITAKDRILLALSRVSSAEKWEEKVSTVVNDVQTVAGNEGFTGKTLRRLNVETKKHAFFASMSDGLLFEYNIQDNEVVVLANPSMGIREAIVFDPTDREMASKYFYLPAVDYAQELIERATFEHPEVEFEAERDAGNYIRHYKVKMLCIYSEDKQAKVSVVGKITKSIREKQ